MAQGLLSRVLQSGIVVMLVTMLGLAAASAQSSNERYTINAGDVLVISVLEDPELDSQVLVLPDGTFSFPIVGSVVAEGRTPEQLGAFLRNRLSGNFVEPPNVTVSITQLANGDVDPDDILTIYVVGEVNRPGPFQVEGEDQVDVLRALALAGGLGPFAANERIQVRTPLEEGGQVLRLFDYSAIEDGRVSAGFDLEPLVDGTVVVVPERGLFE